MLKKRFKKASFLFLIALLFLFSAATSLNLHNKSEELLSWNERASGRAIIQLIILQQSYVSLLIKLEHGDVERDELITAYDLNWSAYEVLLGISQNAYFVKGGSRLLKLKTFFLIFKESDPLKVNLTGDNLATALQNAQQAHDYSIELLNYEFQGYAKGTYQRDFELVRLNKMMIIGLLGLTMTGCIFLLIILRERQQMAYLAYHDPLTKIANRSALEEKINLLQHDRVSFCAILVDLDRFKSINDRYGHDIGDKLLIVLTLEMSEIYQKPSFVGRLGGDEFAIVYIAKSAVEQSVLTLLEITKSPINIEGYECDIGLSIGITYSRSRHRSWVDILKEADEAMYQAKLKGGNQYHIYNETTDNR